MNYLNIAGYKFVDLEEGFIHSIRYPLRTLCRELELKGTIILSCEGINVVLSGPESSVRSVAATLNGHLCFSDLHFKESWSEDIAFNRMLVKVKAEIIPTGISDLRPPLKTAPYMKPAELKSWIDEGREFVLLDTRNDYEVSVGTFTNAVDLNIGHFRSFPQAVKELTTDIKQKPIVTFCTGGIRCEKAAPLMLAEGFSEVYQLEGGILQYFEDLGAEHYEGECFVFDQRVAVDGNLMETETAQCFRCQQPLTVAEQQSPLYKVGQQCPKCAHLNVADQQAASA